MGEPESPSTSQPAQGEQTERWRAGAGRRRQGALAAPPPPAPAGAAPLRPLPLCPCRCVAAATAADAANGEVKKLEGLDALPTVTKRKREWVAGGAHCCTSFPPSAVHVFETSWGRPLACAAVALLAGWPLWVGMAEYASCLHASGGTGARASSSSLAHTPAAPGPRSCRGCGCSGAQPDDWRGQGSAGGCRRSGGGKEHQRLHHRQSRICVRALQACSQACSSCKPC